MRNKHRHGINKEATFCFVTSLRDCAKEQDLCRGIAIHDQILRCGLLKKCSDALVTMYAKCGALVEAKDLLDSHKSRDMFTWTALTAAYAHKGQPEDALNCYEHMRREGFSVDAVTFTCVLKACGSLRVLDKGERIHDEIAKQGLLNNDILLGNSLVDMYAKCGALQKARQVLLEELATRDVISWNVLISGYARQGDGDQAFYCFERMQRESLSPDAATFTCILKACGSLGAFHKGENICAAIVKQGLLGSNALLGCAMVDMYVKCDALSKAGQVFEELPVRDAISWNALIAGHVEQGNGARVLTCFEQMQEEGLSPDEVTFVCILKACGSIGSLGKGEEVHENIVKQGLLGHSLVLGNALVDMYAKCGALVKAQQVLEKLPNRNVISWTALISGYVHQGKAFHALASFNQMLCEGHSPDPTTYSCVLSACSRLGVLDHASMLFEDMSVKHGVKRGLEHYACMVDLFGRAGHLDKAVRVIKKMPSSDRGVWCALMSACQKWGDVDVAGWALEHAIQVEEA